MEHYSLNIMHLLKKDGRKDYASLFKQKAIFNERFAERSSEITNLNQKINCKDLSYYFKTNESSPKNVSAFGRRLSFFKKDKRW